MGMQTRGAIIMTPRASMVLTGRAALDASRPPPDAVDVTQGTVAATMLQHLGLDWRKFNPDAAAPVPGSLKPQR